MFNGSSTSEKQEHDSKHSYLVFYRNQIKSNDKMNKYHQNMLPFTNQNSQYQFQEYNDCGISFFISKTAKNKYFTLTAVSSNAITVLLKFFKPQTKNKKKTTRS